MSVAHNPTGENGNFLHWSGQPLRTCGLWMSRGCAELVPPLTRCGAPLAGAALSRTDPSLPGQRGELALVVGVCGCADPEVLVCENELCHRLPWGGTDAEVTAPPRHVRQSAKLPPGS